MKKLIDNYNERLANDEKFNQAIISGSIILQGICTIGIITASYFEYRYGILSFLLD